MFARNGDFIYSSRSILILSWLSVWSETLGTNGKSSNKIGRDKLKQSWKIYLVFFFFCWYVHARPLCTCLVWCVVVKSIIFPKLLWYCPVLKLKVKKKKKRVFSNGKKKSQDNVLDGTRTHNLWLRRPTPYPLGHKDSTPIACVNFCI